MESNLNKKIRIVYLVASLKRCGPTQQLLGIISNLSEEFEAIVISLKNESNETYIDDFIEKKVNIKQLNYNNNLECILYKKEIFKVIIELNPDIIHSSGIISDYLNSKITGDFHHTTTIRNDIFFESYSNYGYIKGYIIMKIWKSIILKTEIPICCSTSLKTTYQEKLKNKKFYCIRNGVDTNKYNVNQDSKKFSKLKRELKIKESDIVFITTGILNDRKNPLFLIDSFTKCHKDNVKLILIGDGDFYKECKCKSKNNNNILVLGFKKNVSDYLKIADIYISTSKSEGLPNSVLEAGSTGLKLVLSKIPQHLEIGADKDFISYFNLDAQQELIELINKSDKNYDCEKKQIAKYFNDNFSSNKTSNEYSVLYKRMVRR